MTLGTEGVAVLRLSVTTSSHVSLNAGFARGIQLGMLLPGMRLPPVVCGPAYKSRCTATIEELDGHGSDVPGGVPTNLWAITALTAGVPG